MYRDAINIPVYQRSYSGMYVQVVVVVGGGYYRNIKQG